MATGKTPILEKQQFTLQNQTEAQWNELQRAKDQSDANALAAIGNTMDAFSRQHVEKAKQQTEAEALEIFGELQDEYTALATQEAATYDQIGTEMLGGSKGVRELERSIARKEQASTASLQKKYEMEHKILTRELMAANPMFASEIYEVSNRAKATDHVPTLLAEAASTRASTQAYVTDVKEAMLERGKELGLSEWHYYNNPSWFDEEMVNREMDQRRIEKAAFELKQYEQIGEPQMRRHIQAHIPDLITKTESRIGELLEQTGLPVTDPYRWQEQLQDHLLKNPGDAQVVDVAVERAIMEARLEFTNQLSAELPNGFDGADYLSQESIDAYLAPYDEYMDTYRGGLGSAGLGKGATIRENTRKILRDDSILKIDPDGSLSAAAEFVSKLGDGAVGMNFRAQLDRELAPAITNLFMQRKGNANNYGVGQTTIKNKDGAEVQVPIATNDEGINYDLEAELRAQDPDISPAKVKEYTTAFARANFELANGEITDLEVQAYDFFRTFGAEASSHKKAIDKGAADWEDVTSIFVNTILSPNFEPFMSVMDETQQRRIRANVVDVLEYEIKHVAEARAGEIAGEILGVDGMNADGSAEALGNWRHILDPIGPEKPYKAPLVAKPGEPKKVPLYQALGRKEGRGPADNRLIANPDRFYALNQLIRAEIVDGDITFVAITPQELGVDVTDPKSERGRLWTNYDGYGEEDALRVQRLADRLNTEVARPFNRYADAYSKLYGGKNNYRWKRAFLKYMPKAWQPLEEPKKEG